MSLKEPELPRLRLSRAYASLDENSYAKMIAAALEYIAAGDIYQANLSQRFLWPYSDPISLFSALQGRNPMPFASYVDVGGLSLVSNSPECFLDIDGSRVATYPIKGTRPRGETPEIDREMVRELMDDRKESAEHLMIVDLERNDLGRICRVGSVRVPDFARSENFPFAASYSLRSRWRTSQRSVVG